MTRRRRQMGRRAGPPPAAEPMETNPRLGAAILEVVDTQLKDGTPPETRQTFDRLVDMGYTPEGARQLIAYVVVREIFTVMSRGQVYDNARFVAALHRLPTLPDADEAL